MLFIAVAIAFVAVLIVPGLRMRSRGDPAHLGSMSEQWLAQHRASHLA
jgi:hypothetical protein